MKSKRAVVTATALFALLAVVATTAVSASAAKDPPKLPWAAPAVPVGGNPFGVGVAQATNTIYVANSFDNTVSVIDGAACNAIRTSGCSQAAPTVTIGNFGIGLAVDQATNTIYVANAGDNTVSVINGATATLVSPPAAAKPRPRSTSAASPSSWLSTRPRTPST